MAHDELCRVVLGGLSRFQVYIEGPQGHAYTAYYMLVASIRDERYSGYLMFRNATEEECIVISRILAMVLIWSSCFFCLLLYFLPFKWTARTLTPSDMHRYSPTSKHTQSVVLPSACTCDSLHCSNSALPSWSKLHYVLSIMINDSTKISIRHHRDIYVY